MIESELEGAAEFIDSAKRALEGSALGSFADAAHTATEMLARAELLRLPDPRLNSARTHDTVRSRYHLWARLGNTDPRFAALLSSLAEWQRSAKYERSKFSLTVAKAADCMETIAEMQCHAERRPKRRLAIAGRRIRRPPRQEVAAKRAFHEANPSQMHRPDFPRASCAARRSPPAAVRGW